MEAIELFGIALLTVGFLAACEHFIQWYRCKQRELRRALRVIEYDGKRIYYSNGKR
jgi:hypothetical protein